MKTMILLILDRSGSMKGRETDVVGGVNAFIDEQKKSPDPAWIGFVRFDGEAVERFRPMQALAEVKPLAPSDYQPRGDTPLLDAVGSEVVKLDEDWKTLRPERAIVLIVTDGQENASKEYTKAKVRALIESRQNSGMWSFIYLGANVDSFAEASALGIQRANTANYRSTSLGTRSAYAAAAGAVRHMRFTGEVKASNLGRDIGEDEVGKWSGAFDSSSISKTSIPDATPSASAWTPPTATAASDKAGWAPPA